MTEIYWINTGLKNKLIGIMPRPRGNDWLEDEIRYFKFQGIQSLVSLLESSEIIELDLEKEEYFCKRFGINYFTFPIKDRSIPRDISSFNNFIVKLSKEYYKQNKIAIHCRMGIGRSSITAAAIMINLGFSVENSIEKISKAREYAVPDTLEQFEWLKKYYKYIKNRNFT